MPDNAIFGWDVTAANNGGTSDSTLTGLGDGVAMEIVNNSMRAAVARVAAFLKLLGGAATYGGSGNAYTITSASGHALTAYATGQIVCLVPNATNTGAATVNIDGLGAKSIVTADGGAVVSGDLVSGGRYLMAYDGTNFQVLNTLAGGSYQPLDADLSALAALTTDAAGRSVLALTDPNADRIAFWDDSASAFGWLQASTGLSLSGTTLAVSSNLQAYSAVTPSAFALTLFDDADASAARTTLGLTIGTNVQAFAANLTTWAGLAPSAFFQTLVDDANASAARTTLGLGTAATRNTGTSGNTIPLLDGSNVFSAAQRVDSDLNVGTSRPGHAAFEVTRATNFAMHAMFGSALPIYMAGGTNPKIYFNMRWNGSAFVYGLGSSSNFAGYLEFNTSTGVFALNASGAAGNADATIGASTTSTIWHAGNDGAGSGLDADTVDGVQASAFSLVARGPVVVDSTISIGSYGDTLVLHTSGSPHTYTLPTSTTDGTRITVVNIGTGTVTLTAASGADLVRVDGTYGIGNRTMTQGDSCTLIRASSAGGWLIFGHGLS